MSGGLKGSGVWLISNCALKRAHKTVVDLPASSEQESCWRWRARGRPLWFLVGWGLAAGWMWDVMEVASSEGESVQMTSGLKSKRNTNANWLEPSEAVWASSAHCYVKTWTKQDEATAWWDANTKTQVMEVFVIFIFFLLCLTSEFSFFLDSLILTLFFWTWNSRSPVILFCVRHALFIYFLHSSAL